MRDHILCSPAVTVLLLFVFSGFSAVALPADPQRPNVIFILADDLGWSDTTLYGNTKFHQTPNLQRLADRGMLFTRGYSASPLCSPTRSAILTGLSPARTGITTPSGHVAEVILEAQVAARAAPQHKAVMPVSVTRLKSEYRTLAEALQDAGYATAHFGKWHLGPAPWSPLQQGFDTDLPHHPGPGPAGSYVAPWKFGSFTERNPGEHIEDRMAAEASAWIEQHRDEPFFLNYWAFSVHAPFNAKADLVEKHRLRIDPNDLQRCPTYAAMLESFDDAVGTLLGTLDRLQLSDRTIIVFTSDNGGNMYNDVDGTTPTSNRPLRGGKATLFEGGTRVPTVVVWPGLTAPGSRSDVPVQSEDYYPTLLDGLGLRPADGQQFDGSSFLPALRGEVPERPPLFQYFPHNPAVPDWLPPAVSVHRGDWKLIRIFHGGDNGAHRLLLFDLANDPGEQRNLAAEQPELAVDLDGLVEQFLQHTKAVVPIRNPAFDPQQYDPTLEGKSQPKRQKPAAGRQAAAAGPAEDAAVLQGWKPRGCTAEVQQGVLVLRGTGREPFLGFAPGKLDGKAVLRVRVRSSGGSGRLQWLTAPAAQPLPEYGAVSFSVQAGDWVELKLAVQSPADAGGILRLFMPAQETAVEIDWLELTTFGKTRRWDFESAD